MHHDCLLFYDYIYTSLMTRVNKQHLLIISPGSIMFVPSILLYLVGLVDLYNLFAMASQEVWTFWLLSCSGSRWSSFSRWSGDVLIVASSITDLGNLRYLQWFHTVFCMLSKIIFRFCEVFKIIFLLTLGIVTSFSHLNIYGI